jgi:hypothetical protein
MMKYFSKIPCIACSCCCSCLGRRAVRSHAEVSTTELGGESRGGEKGAELALIFSLPRRRWGLGTAVEGNGAWDSAQFLFCLAEPPMEESRAVRSSIAPAAASMGASPFVNRLKPQFHVRRNWVFKPSVFMWVGFLNP